MANGGEARQLTPHLEPRGTLNTTPFGDDTMDNYRSTGRHLLSRIRTGAWEIIITFDNEERAQAEADERNEAARRRVKRANEAKGLQPRGTTADTC